MFTPLQTLDLAGEITALLFGGVVEVPWGHNEEALASKFNPLVEEVFKTLSGWDSFTREQVAGSIPDLLRRIIDPRERFASWKRIEKILNDSTGKGLYKTTEFQNWMRLLLGGLAPVDVDPAVAKDMAAKKKLIAVPDQTPEERIEEWAAEATEAFGQAPPPHILELKRVQQVHDEIGADYEREHNLRGEKTPQRLVAILYLTDAALHPERAEAAKAKAEWILTQSDETAEAYKDALRGPDFLNLTLIDSIDRKKSAALGEGADDE
jgi:hypothetical protein